MDSQRRPKRDSRAVRWAVITGAFLGALAAAFVAATVAIAAFSSTTSAGPQTVASATLVAPSGLTATPAGHDVSLGWSAGTNGTGYSLLGVANGGSSDCSLASFASLALVSGLATSSYSDLLRFSPQGSWYCYQMKTSAGTSWTSVSSNPTAAVQLGFVASSVTLANGGSAGSIDSGDQIIFTFNQSVNTSSGPSGSNSVCSIGGATIVIGAIAAGGGCSAGESNLLGTLTGGTASRAARWAATWDWSNSNQTLTVTLGSRTVGPRDPTSSGTWTFNPVNTAADLLSSAGSFHICDTDVSGSACLPTVSGSF